MLQQAIDEGGFHCFCRGHSCDGILGIPKGNAEQVCESERAREKERGEERGIVCARVCMVVCVARACG